MQLFPKVWTLELSIKAFRISGSAFGFCLKAVFWYPYPVTNSLSCGISNLQRGYWVIISAPARGGTGSGCRSRIQEDSRFFFRTWNRSQKFGEKRTRCQAKFLTSAKFLTCCCFSVILLLRIKKLSLAISFSMCVVEIKAFWLDVRNTQQAIAREKL